MVIIMALCSQKKTAAKKVKAAAPHSDAACGSSAVLQSPRVTGLGMGQSEQNVYAFKVARSASKYDVRDTVKALYGVTPVKVNIVNKAPRQFKHANTRRVRTEHGIKKAYVYLKKGDTISLI